MEKVDILITFEYLYIFWVWWTVYAKDWKITYGNKVEKVFFCVDNRIIFETVFNSNVEYVMNSILPSELIPMTNNFDLNKRTKWST